MNDHSKNTKREVSDSDTNKLRDLFKRYIDDSFDPNNLIEFLSSDIILEMAQDILRPDHIGKGFQSLLKAQIDLRKRFRDAALELVDARKVVEYEADTGIALSLKRGLENHNSSERELTKVMAALVDTVDYLDEIIDAAAEHSHMGMVLSNSIQSKIPDPTMKGSGRAESGTHYVTRQLAEQIGNRINRTQKSKLISEIFQVLGIELTWQSINQKLRDSQL